MQDPEKIRFPFYFGNSLSPAPDTPDPIAPPRRFQFTIKTLPEDRKILHFPFASVSDVHWGTRASRAKRFAHMMTHSEADELHAVGDMVDLTYLVKKRHWNMGPWHRQGIAHVLRKAHEGTKTLYYRGNHETGMRVIADHHKDAPARIWRDGKREIMGIKLIYDHVRQDARGRSQFIIHGDIFDHGAFESEKLKGIMGFLVAALGSQKNAENFVYTVCNSAYQSLYSVDSVLQSLPLLENASLAACAKRAFKGFINERLDIRRVIGQALDDSPHDVMIYGHSHMSGFEWTKGGKLLINDGCSTEHVNMLVQDQNGTFAILTWHKDGMEVEEEPLAPGQESLKYFLGWKELGLDHFGHDAPMMNNQYTARADRVLRLIYRLAPPKEHVEIKERLIRHRHLLENFGVAIDMQYKPTPSEIIQFHRMMTDLRQEEQKIRQMDAMLPKPRLMPSAPGPELSRS